MGYVIAAIVVVLIVAAGIAIFVHRATAGKAQTPAATPDEGTAPAPAPEHPSPGVGGPGEGGAGGEGEGSRPVAR